MSVEELGTSTKCGGLLKGVKVHTLLPATYVGCELVSVKVTLTNNEGAVNFQVWSLVIAAASSSC